MTNTESICANCLKAKVYIEPTLTSTQPPEWMHYVKCLEDKWTRRVHVYSAMLKATRHCEQYVSMSDDPDDLNEYLDSLPINKMDYDNVWRYADAGR